MRPLSVASLLLAMMAGGSAWAQDGAAKAPAWTVGGAVNAAGDGARFSMWERGGVSFGVADLPHSGLAAGAASGMQLGGFLAWLGEGYRVEATVAPAMGGDMTAGLGATIGSTGDHVGTSYGVRLGTAWGADRFTVNPASGLGLAEVAPGNDVNLSFTVNHALTPNLNVTGTAEAHHVVGAVSDGGAAQNRFLVGAGLGYRF